VILLRAGDSVPADCRLLEAFSVRIIAVLAMAMAARRMAKPERR
jgi:magnesium-transporting ATPase (P-type)